MTIKALREKYPEYSDMSDEQFAQAFHRKFYSDMSFEDFGNKVGFNQKVKEPVKVQNRAGFLESVPLGFKESMAGLGNRVDTAWSMMAGSLANVFSEDQAADIYKNLDERIQSRNQWANPENKKAQGAGKLIGSLPTLPSQAVAGLVSPFETAKTFVDAGEGNKARRAIAVDSLANLVMYGTPAAIGGDWIQKALSGAAIGAGSYIARQKALEGLADTPELKKQMAVDGDAAAEAALLGAFIGPMSGAFARRSTKSTEPTNTPSTQEMLKTIETPVKQEPVQVPELNPGSSAFNRITDTLNPTARDIPQPPKPVERSALPDITRYLSEELPAARAQEVIDARQKQLEFDVKKQTTLDMNAAERARQERAPTGAAEAEMAQRMRELEERQRFFDQAKQDSIVEDYGSVDPLATMPNMRIDENGIPIRADLSMEIQNLQNPLQMGLFGDELPIQTGDGGIPMTQALDMMPPGPARDLAISQLSGIPPRSLSGAAESPQAGGAAPKRKQTVGEAPTALGGTSKRLGGRGIGFRGQRGAVDLGDIGKTFANAKRALQKGYDAKQEIVIRPTGIDDEYIPRGKDAQTIIKEAIENPGSDNLWENLQSGALVAGQKVDSPLLTEVGRWHSWAEKVGQKGVREVVQPLEKMMGRMSRLEVQQLMEIRMAASKNKRAFTPDELRKAGFSDKVIEGVQKFDEAYATTMESLNRARRAAGLKDITPLEAYYSSRWTGNYMVPVHDAKGRLVSFIRTDTRGEAIKAINWVKKNHPEWSVANEPVYKEAPATGIPKNFTDTYAALQEVFKDTPLGGELNALLENYKADQAFAKGNFPVHFENKTGVGFFLGDRPWLSAGENAMQAAKSQMDYLAEAQRWSPWQEANATLKEVLANPDVLATQPKNAHLADLYNQQALGSLDNILKDVESGVAKRLGISPRNISEATAALKSLTYLHQLGVSAGYSIATVSQAFMLGPAEHMRMTKKGLKYNPVKAAMNSSVDTAAILGEHAVREGFGIQDVAPMSPLAKEALRYLEDNGIINANLWDEYANLGQNKTIDAAKNTIGLTISLPEKVARVATFMSFVHHMKDGGMKVGPELFRAAEEATNNTLTNFHRSARPLYVGRLGNFGELAYTYQSPLFNYYNQVGKYAREALRGGSKAPFLYATVLAPVMLGGIMNIPGMEEFEGMLSTAKALIAQHAPDIYPKVANLSVKEQALRNLPDALTYGALSTGTNIQLASRHTVQAFDFEDPMANMFPTASTIKAGAEAAYGLFDVGPLGVSVTDNPREIAQSLYKVLPSALRGTLETTSPEFKAGERKADGTQNYYNPNKLRERNVNISRTESDEFMRKFGLFSMDEHRTKDVRFLNSKIDRREATARTSSMTRMVDSLLSGDEAKVKRYARSYFENGGDRRGFTAGLNKAILDANLTPEQAQIVRMRSLSQLRSYIRREEMTQ